MLACKAQCKKETKLRELLESEGRKPSVQVEEASGYVWFEENGKMEADNEMESN